MLFDWQLMSSHLTCGSCFMEALKYSYGKKFFRQDASCWIRLYLQPPNILSERWSGWGDPQRNEVRIDSESGLRHGFSIWNVNLLEAFPSPNF